MSNDKTILLKSLSLGSSAREADTSSRGSPWSMLGIGLVTGALVAGSLVWFLVPRKSPSKPVATDITADTTAPTTPAAQQAGDLIASGYVVARRRATVAAEITGRVIDVRVEEGQAVAKGQILAVLDSDLARNDLISAKSRVAAASATINSLKADLAEARRIAERTRSLASKEFASTADLTRTQARVTSLEAQLARAEADVGTARSDANRISVQLGKYEIRAPFAGIVVDKNAQAGEIISPMSAGGGFTRTGICTLVDMNSLEIEVDVNEAYIGRVVKDQKVDAVLDAYPDVTFPARVIATVPTANREKATVRVRIALINHDPRILPDMAIKVTFLEKQS
jgi:HlyD family secretion protein